MKLSKKGQRAVTAAVVLLSAAAVLFFGYHIYTSLLIDRIGTLDDPSYNHTNTIPTETMSPDYTGAVVDDVVIINDKAKYVEEIEIQGDTKYITNILLLGIETEGKPGYNGRSDSIMVLSINKQPGNESIRLISILRDLCVPVEGHGPQKLNSAYSSGGYKLLLDTIKKQLRLDIKKVVAVNFDAFMLAIDAMNGIEIELTAAEAREIKIGRNAGVYELDGENALAYSRIRVIGNDWGRTERQRKVIGAAIQKAKTMNILTLNQVLFEVFPEIQTNLTREEMKDYISKSPAFLKYNVKETYMPEIGTFTDPYVKNVGRALVLNDAAATVRALLHFIYG